MSKKGILLAGGLGTRFRPITYSVNKHFLPIYKKPMFFYPLSVLMLAGINDIIIVSDTSSLKIFKKIISKLNLSTKFSYIAQNKPGGIVDGILKCKKKINNKDFVVILGDNFFYAQSLSNQLQQLMKKKNCIVSVKNKKPAQFGVIKFKNKKMYKIIEKPKKFISNNIVTGIYSYENKVIKLCEKLKPSKRGELEITDLNNIYISNKSMKVSIFGRGTNWLDTGTPEGLLEASNFVSAVQKSSGNKIACIEEIALNNRWISNKYLKKLIDNIYKNSFYKNYIGKLVE